MSEENIARLMEGAVSEYRTKALEQDAERAVSDQLDRIEKRLEEIRATTEILVAVRLIEDLHATNMREALVLARDPEKLKLLYPPYADRWWDGK